MNLRPEAPKEILLRSFYKPSAIVAKLGFSFLELLLLNEFLSMQNVVFLRVSELFIQAFIFN